MEQEWLEGSDPGVLFEFLQDQASERKTWLAACSSVRHVWNLLPSGSSFRKAVEACEQEVDGLIPREQIDEVLAVTRQEREDLGKRPVGGAVVRACSAALATAFRGETAKLMTKGVISELCPFPVDGHALCQFLRDIFGNPFRPVTLDPRWLTSTVLDLANLIYNERAFERLPILADALMDAGCDSEEIIGHCQGPGPHVRGCWVVDLLTGRA